MRMIVPLVALALLAGCTEQPKRKAGAGTAEGEILDSSTSDAMLPLDTVRSEAPLAPKAEGGDDKGKAADKPAAKGAAAAEAETAEGADEPAAEQPAEE